MKKILILYSKTGGGHLRAAEAIAEAFKEKDCEVVLIDALSKTNSDEQFHPDKVFIVFSTTLLPLYNFLYHLTNNKFGTSVIRRIIKAYWGKGLAKAVQAHAPDLIISTHTSPTPTTIAAKLTCPFVTVCTDLGEPHALWYDKTVDAFIVANDNIANYYKKNNSNESNIEVLGLPIKNIYSTISPSRVATKNILIVGGGSGSGHIDQQVAILQSTFPEHTFSVICGMNTELQKSLAQKEYPNVKLFGFVDNLAEHIAHADIVLTKAGPASIIEAASLKKPLIISSWIGPQEKDNVDYVIDNHLGVYCPDFSKLPEAINTIYAKYNEFSTNDIQIKNGSEKIADYLLKRFF